MKIFLSYRRADSAYVVDRIRDRLIAAFGNTSVFRDIEDVPLGRDFRSVIEDVARNCDVMLVIIGPQWTNITDSEAKKRLLDPADYTRIEIETGLNHEGILVIPILVMNAVMPASSELPNSLQALIFRNAIDVRNDPDFENDMQRLISGIKCLQTSSEAIIPDQSSDKTSAIPSRANDGKQLEVKIFKEKSRHGKLAPDGSLVKPLLFGITALLAIAITAGIVIARKTPSLIASVGMVRVPEGKYTIGTETPVQLREYWIDRYEITNGDYKKYLKATDLDPPEYWKHDQIPAGLRNHPVRQITWQQAEKYCSSVGKRLPTEAEWEIAARGPFLWLYPWGNDADKVKQERVGTRPVDSNPTNRSYYGAYYMSGNVWEWVGNPYTKTSGGQHVLRGGAFGARDVLSYAILSTDADNASEKAGLRCAANAENVARTYDDILALDDRFESSDTGWPRIHQDTFLFDYHEVGFYHLEARESNKFVAAFYQPATYSSYVVETGVFVDKRNTDNKHGAFLYGLGVQYTGDQFYGFLVSARDQVWQIVKGTVGPDARLGNASDLEIIQSGKEGSIRGASEEEDRLTVITNGQEFIYYVNGKLVASLTVEGYQRGKVGFIVETLDDVTRVHIHFNWITLQKIYPFDNDSS